MVCQLMKLEKNANNVCMKIFNHIIIFTVTISLLSCNLESKSTDYFYDSGELRMQKFDTDNDSVKKIVLYYKNGSIFSVFNQHENGDIVGERRAFYPDGELMIKSRYVKETSYNDYYSIPPTEDSCYIQIDGFFDKSGKLIKFHTCDVVTLKKDSSYWFRFYADGIPPFSFYYFTSADGDNFKGVEEVEFNNIDFPVNFPFVIDTSNTPDSLFLYCVFHEKDCVVLGKSPSVVFPLVIK